MNEDVQSHISNIINNLTDSFFNEIKKIVNNDVFHIDGYLAAGKVPGESGVGGDCSSQVSLQSVGGMRPDLAALASQFVRALAAEAARMASEGGGAGRPAASTSGIPSPNQPTSGDLEAMVIEDWAGRVAGSTYLEEHLRIPRSTLHRWYRGNEVVALRKGRQRHVFPLAQFVDGRPASGIREVLSHIPHPRLAWFWLIQPSPGLGGRIPIELLKQDIVADVIAAAKEHSAAS
ncbi:DUF2384 domain-containing protein [Mesorhizobium sp. CC13]|uniref:antitoxin Xre/MbcA/ParS-like domain-containing protein n=1 Tax=Mesorhizobium sp. CC13 TaxID=3029194 RepID=UPI0032638ADB